ncbi:pantetheine-phosphate adenylyltransferase [Vampirovibrio chlorellavorus]|uniref:pantetheine-phosphate adenylyltransferase n=1 Tax=Vampirovibrio chlorellavorus TaxID=758823 RepID=UPI0026F297FE|nr:pantetheine-phosphate adenylyltransferase [Vampirovibrio chlorellavorus]
MTIAVYPGSFDPITLGHVDIVTRASQMFERVIMAVVKNPQKRANIELSTRVSLVEQSLKHLPNIQVESFEGLTVDLAKAHQAKIIIRGLRAVSDFEFEFAMSQMNKRLCPNVETLFMMAGLEYQFLSSSMTNEVARLGGSIEGLVPEQVREYYRSQSQAAEKAGT